MKEESQLEDMRAALRGDRERAERRRREQARPAAPPVSQPPDAAPEPEPEAPARGFRLRSLFGR